MKTLETAPISNRFVPEAKSHHQRYLPAESIPPRADNTQHNVFTPTSLAMTTSLLTVVAALAFGEPIQAAGSGEMKLANNSRRAHSTWDVTRTTRDSSQEVLKEEDYFYVEKQLTTIAAQTMHPLTAEDLWQAFRVASKKEEAAAFYRHRVFRSVSPSEQVDFLFLVMERSPSSIFRDYEAFTQFLPSDVLVNTLLRALDYEQDFSKTLRYFVEIKDQNIYNAVFTKIYANMAASFAARASSLPPHHQYALFLGVTKNDKAGSSEVRDFADDEALQENFEFIENDWIVNAVVESNENNALFRNFREYIQIKILIARNLRFRNNPVTPETVAAAYREIAQQRRIFSSLSLYRGRDVVYVAGDDTAPNGAIVFGNSPVQTAIERQGGKLDFVLSQNQKSSRQDRENRIRAGFQAPAPTVIFDTHGKRNGVKIDGGIFTAELADLIASRRLHTSKNALENIPIIIISSCQGHNFLRNIIARLQSQNPGAPLPIIICLGEYGQNIQAGSLDMNAFKSKTVREEHTTLGSFLAMDGELQFSMYVPSQEDGTIQQIM